LKEKFGVGGFYVYLEKRAKSPLECYSKTADIEKKSFKYNGKRSWLHSKNKMI